MVYITRGLYPIFPHENPIYVLYYICIVSIIIPEKDVEQGKKHQNGMVKTFPAFLLWVAIN